jgi:hypothetical protein
MLCSPCWAEHDPDTIAGFATVFFIFGNGKPAFFLILGTWAG